jgi:hypothetical protein
MVKYIMTHSKATPINISCEQLAALEMKPLECQAIGSNQGPIESQLQLNITKNKYLNHWTTQLLPHVTLAQVQDEYEDRERESDLVSRTPKHKDRPTCIH